MAKSKAHRTPKRPNSAKVQLAAIRALQNDKLNRHKQFSRTMWSMIIALDEMPDVIITDEQILSLIDKISDNLIEYQEIAKRDGQDIADEKLNMRVNTVFGADPFADSPNKLYNSNETGEKENE